MSNSIESKHLPGLDLLRFLLSVTILVVHFHFFYSPFFKLDSFDWHINPFYSVLRPVYFWGGLAVEAFWMISGVIFFYFYLSVIQEKKMSLFTFVGLRFSRLYPLHFLTLCSVAVLQYFYHARFDTTLVYINNDALHFVLNLLMIGFWNAKFGLSFNGPFWSVSVEMFVYLLFFISVWSGVFKKKANFFWAVGICLFFYCLGILSPFYDCMFYFFAGCFVAKHFKKINLKWLILIVLVSLFFLAAKYRFPQLRNNFYAIRIIDLLIKTGVFTLLIYFFGQLFSGMGNKSRKILREIGNMTYASYMIHVSVIIILVLLFYNKGIQFFTSPIFFISYIIGTSVLGYVIYRMLELPIQKLIRKRLDRLGAQNADVKDLPPAP